MEADESHANLLDQSEDMDDNGSEHSVTDAADNNEAGPNDDGK